MDPVRNILAIVDPTAEKHPAVTKAAQLAERLRARLELYICDTRAAHELRLAEHYRKQPREPFRYDLKAMLESLAEPLRKRGIDVATEVESGDPLHVALIDKTVRTSANLVVKDTHHHSLAQRTVLTHTDWELIRGCPVPLLLTKPKPWAMAPTLLAAVDPWHANDKPMLLDHRLLEHAALLAQKLDGELQVLHVYMPAVFMAAAIAGGAPGVGIVSPEDLAIERQAKLDVLAPLVGEFNIRPQNLHLEIGSPADWLPRAARDLHADIVTMGAISRSGLRRVFVGSTAEEVLERLPCDALIVKPLDFSTAWPA